MRRLLREPLLHFLALGALLFAAHGLVNRGGEPAAGRIVVTRGKIENLRDAFGRVWQRPPSAAELEGLVQDYVREEVLVREAIALGLDRDDTVIRRRLRQKMEFIAADAGARAEPSEAELTSFLAEHPELFRVEPRFAFRQVYLSPERRGDALTRDAARLLDALDQAGADADVRTLGDPTLLSAELVDVPASEVTGEFGEEFTRQLATLPEGRWSGPVTSGYGTHLVWVRHRTPGRTPALAEVRNRVAREWVEAERRAGNERFYQDLRARYTVTIERSPVAAAETSTRTARVRP